MSLKKSLSVYSNIEGYVICDEQGEISIHKGNIDPDITASVSAVMRHEMSALESILGTGRTQAVEFKGKKTKLVVFKKGKIATIGLRDNVNGHPILNTMKDAEWIDDTHVKRGAVRRSCPPPIPKPPLSKKHQLQSTPSSMEPPPLRTPPQPPERIDLSSPEAQALKNLRFALFLGDIASAKAQHVEMTELALPPKRESQPFIQFEIDMNHLTRIITQLLLGKNEAAVELDSFLTKGEALDPTLNWAGLIWQTRCLLATGAVEEAERAAIAASLILGKVDSDTRVATGCCLANVAVTSGNPDKALDVLQSYSHSLKQCQMQTIRGMVYLIESQALAAKNQPAQSTAAAVKAEEMLPRSPYPKLMQARLRLLRRDISGAEALYQEILTLNPKQPDALSDKELVALMQEDEVRLTNVSSYLARREAAPTLRTMDELLALQKRASDVNAFRNLLAWRLCGLGNTEEAKALFDSSNPPEKGALPSYRFKPHIAIGLGPSAIMVAGYQNLIERLEILPRQEEDDEPIHLSMLPEEIQEMMDSSVEDNFFSGELNMFSMPDLLEFLRNGHRTGSLICSTKNGVGAIELAKGFVSSAIVPNADHLGDILLKQGKITKENISSALDSQQKDLAGTRMGAVLVEKGLVDAETIKSAILEQTFAAIKVMLDWTDGRFVFTPSPEQDAPNPSVEVKLDSQHILMELFRQIDESNR